jgi:hypothetical protein
VSPESEWLPPGAVVRLDAIPDVNHVFRDWVGQGTSSYTGPDNPASVTLDGPVVETARFEQFGADLAISASAVDPFENTAAPAGAPRQLHLWVTCADEGVSALEVTTLPSGGLTVVAFAPGQYVLNAGDASHLLLAVGGCPVETPFRLGSWTVIDEGGSLCLGEQPPALFAVVECRLPNPGLVLGPRTIGFSSAGAPCQAGENGCEGALPLARAAPPPAAEHDPSLPDFLSGAAPNPFRERTDIRFSLAAPVGVRLDVHDVAGRLVRRLVDGSSLAPGLHASVWDGRDERGRAVPAGIYFVRLETADGFRATRKVLRLGVR